MHRGPIILIVFVAIVAAQRPTVRLSVLAPLTERAPTCAQPEFCPPTEECAGTPASALPQPAESSTGVALRCQILSEQFAIEEMDAALKSASQYDQSEEFDRVIERCLLVIELARWLRATDEVRDRTSAAEHLLEFARDKQRKREELLTEMELLVESSKMLMERREFDGALHRLGGVFGREEMLHGFSTSTALADEAAALVVQLEGGTDGRFQYYFGRGQEAWARGRLGAALHALECARRRTEAVPGILGAGDAAALLQQVRAHLELVREFDP